MYLKTIKISGFKSFANRVQIDLQDKITGVVGPNGSGKSNIVDAVRWVLGEQSVKSLRGDGAMTDVIFSGSKSRGPLNVASVTLIFDNTDHTLPLDFNEISIKRRVYRDGTNEYFLNNEKCRLKDITDLLLDSGLAKESFNIISQGKIEEILTAKSSERRVIFEEAANVLKYKRRKEDAIRKLDRTHDNINRVSDVISELETQIEPLQEAKSKAEIYVSAKDELAEIEISLLAHDIKEFNDEYEKANNEIKSLNDSIIKLTTSSSQHEASVAKEKNEMLKIDEEIAKLNQEILEMTSKVEKANSRKQIILERKKYEFSKDEIHKNIVYLKEEELKLKNQVSSYELAIDNDSEELNKLEVKYQELNKKIEELRHKRQDIENDINKTYYSLNITNNRINDLEVSIENNGSLPLAVRNVLGNVRLKGIHDTLGNIISVEPDYLTAITTALGSSINNIIVDNQKSAEEAIAFLKANKYGRVTFFPLNVIKPKNIEISRLNYIRKQEGFIDIAAALVKCDQIYSNIIFNQLGTVIVVDNIKNANKLATYLNYQYKIVTLAGEIVHAGGSITGGELAKTRNTWTDKQELDDQNKNKIKLEEKLKSLEEAINEIDNSFQEYQDKLYLVNKEKLEKEEKINITKDNIKVLYEQMSSVTSEISSSNGILNNDISKEENEALNEYYKLLKEKEELEQKYKSLKSKRDEYNEIIEEKESNIRLNNETYRNDMNKLKDLEVSSNRLEVKIDNALKLLSENYSMTYELALEKSNPLIDVSSARTKVNKLRKTIKDLGEVNVGAIEEYKRISERYEFLLNQRNDLNNAENILLDIIKEMDEQMIKDFKETFKIVRENFKIVFKQLFKGGTADLVYTDPKNILETGVEIVASPPGKKLTSISLLSGGEKTLTAISLLFAILKSKETSFCILDEVEAALDEANVDSFGEYIQTLKDKTQFIIITHKKKTMEYADTLYGITMQESGVSKLVSVRLNDIK